MKHTSTSAVSPFVLTPILCLCLLIPTSPIVSADDKKKGVEQSPSSGKQVVVKDVAGGTVAGRVYDDANGDGTKTSDESYLLAISVKLLDVTDDLLVAATKSNTQGIYLFKNIDSGQYQLEFDFGESKKVKSQPFAVRGARSSVIVEPVPYYKGFDFEQKQPDPIKVHRVVTSSELARVPQGTDLSVPPNWEGAPESPESSTSSTLSPATLAATEPPEPSDSPEPPDSPDSPEPPEPPCPCPVPPEPPATPFIP